jgi:hypothetical protein
MLYDMTCYQVREGCVFLPINANTCTGVCQSRAILWVNMCNGPTGGLIHCL